MRPENTSVAVICSAGRPQMLHDTVLSVLKQTVPCVVVLSVTEENDVLPLTRDFAGVEVLIGPRGSCRQRNAALESIVDTPECVLFLDDDVELDPAYLEEVLLCYRQHASVAIVNGRNLAHGIYPAGTLDRTLARSLIAKARRSESDSQGPPPGTITPMETSYGCRMSVRGSLLGKVSFDERLVLYGFLEDLDFALECRRFGSTVESARAFGVHLEVGSSRMGLVRRGYSDVINPLYIARKGTGYPLLRAVAGACLRTFANGASALRSGDAERLKGNLRAWLAAVRGDFRPEQILYL